MPKMKVNTGTPAAPNWVIMDAKDSDTIDGKHASDFSLSTHGHTASVIPIVDTGNKFTATNVENALQEIATNVEGKLATNILSDGTNVNTLITNGSYYVFNGVNAPVSVEGFYFDVVAYSSVYISQTAYTITSNRVYTRRMNNGTWLPWSLVSNEMINLGSGVNANTLTVDGWYHIPQATNVPVAGINFFVQVSKFPASDWTVQNAYAPDDNRIWTRRQVGTVWGTWTQVSNETVNISGVNLDTVLKNGKYDGMNLGNKPVGSGDWGYLDVTQHTQTPSWCTQTYRDFYSNRVWERRGQGGA
jgi:hypothetical protein